MNKNMLALTTFIAVGVAAAQTAAASEPGFYVGGYVGQTSKSDVPREEYEALNVAIQDFSFFTPNEQHNSIDDTDLGFAIVAGYRFTSYFAIEGGYTRLGQVTYTSRASGTFPLEPGTLATNVESETSGFTISVLGTWPLSRDWDLYARAGALLANNTLSLSVRATGDQFIPPPGNAFSDSGSKSSTDLHAGLGVSRRLFEVYDLRLEYQRTFDAGFEITGGQGDLDALFLGLTATF